MKKKMWNIIIILLFIIIFSLFLGKKILHEGAVGAGNSDDYEIIKNDANKTKSDLEQAVLNRNKAISDNNNIENQVNSTREANQFLIKQTESKKKNITDLVTKTMMNAKIIPLVNLPLQKDAINIANDLGISDPSNLTKQMNVGIFGNTTSLNYISIGGKQCVEFKFDYKQYNDLNSSIINYISFPFVNPPQFSFCIWVYINPNDMKPKPDFSNYYTAVSVTNKKNWEPSVQLDTWGNNIFIYSSLPYQWNPIHRYQASSGWTHITYIYDETSNYFTAMYINGVKVSEQNGKSKFIPKGKLQYTPDYFIIGRSGDPYRGFNGYMHDFLYYSMVLNPKDISDIYNNTM